MFPTIFVVLCFISVELEDYTAQTDRETDEQDA